MVFIQIMIAVVSIVIAKRTLDYSKKSSLSKDAYVPILDELVKYKNADNTYDIQYLVELQSSYVYPALNKRAQENTHKIIQKMNEINLIYASLLEETVNSYKEVLDKKLMDKNEKIIKVYSKKSPGKMLDLIKPENINRSVTNLYMGEEHLYIRYGQVGTKYSPCVDEYIEEVFEPDEKEDNLKDLLIKHIERNKPQQTNREEYYGKLGSMIQEILHDIVSVPTFKLLYSEYENEKCNLIKVLEKQEKTIINDLHKNIMPNYTWRKKVKSLKNYLNKDVDTVEETVHLLVIGYFTSLFIKTITYVIKWQDNFDLLYIYFRDNPFLLFSVSNFLLVFIYIIIRYYKKRIALFFQNRRLIKVAIYFIVSLFLYLLLFDCLF